MVEVIKRAALVLYVIIMLTLTMVGAKQITEHWLGGPWAVVVDAVVASLLMLELMGSGPIAKYYQRKAVEVEKEQAGPK